MATQSKQLETMLKNIPDKTGKTLAEWSAILKESGLDKHGMMMKLLKSDYGVTHGFANLIVQQYRSADAPTDTNLVDRQYQGAKAALRPIYDAILAVVESFGDDVEIAPKKTYVSLRRRKQFGLVQPSTRTRVDLGLNLQGTRTSKRLEESGSFNAMVTHRIRLERVEDVDTRVEEWLKKAYEQAG